MKVWQTLKQAIGFEMSLVRGCPLCGTNRELNVRASSATIAAQPTHRWCDVGL